VNGDGKVPHGDVQVTREQFQRLHREVEETKWLTHTAIVALIGKDKADAALAKIDEWLDSDFRRFARGTAVYNVNLGNALAYSRLIDADLFTLEEIAQKTRAEVAAVKGVGQVAMRHLEAAMAERGLSFAEAA
jgi:hypothetical protein